MIFFFIEKSASKPCPAKSIASLKISQNTLQFLSSLVAVKMKIILVLALVYKILALPATYNDRITYPTDVDDSVDDLRTLSELRFLGDSNLLRSVNNSVEFIKDDSNSMDLENGKFFQGDILLIQDQSDFLAAKLGDDRFPSRTGLISETYRWPRSTLKSDKVHVPFVIDDGYCE